MYVLWWGGGGGGGVCQLFCSPIVKGVFDNYVLSSKKLIFWLAQCSVSGFDTLPRQIICYALNNVSTFAELVLIIVCE